MSLSDGFSYAIRRSFGFRNICDWVCALEAITFIANLFSERDGRIAINNRVHPA